MLLLHLVLGLSLGRFLVVLASTARIANISWGI